MIRSSLKCAGALAVLILGACAGVRPSADYSGTIPEEIQQLVDGQYAQALKAVGTDDGPSEGIAERKAEMQARADLARQFKAQVDQLQKSYEESVSDKSLQEYKQTLEIFASLELVGSRKAKTMVKPLGNGDYQAKVLVVISAEQLKGIVDEKMSSLATYKASQAYKELEDRVAKEKEAQAKKGE
jgi:hypothetical protein